MFYVMGLIFIISGIISIVYGVNQNNSFAAQFESLFSSGSLDPGTPFIVIGVIGIVIGFIIIIVGYVKSQNQINYPNNYYSGTSITKRCRCGTVYSTGYNCPNCGSSLFEEVSSSNMTNTGDTWFCKKCREKNPITSPTCKSCGEYK